MATKNRLQRLTESTGDRDRSELIDFCDRCGLVPISEVELRKPVRTGGEVGSVRMVPLAGAPSLEATINDGRGTITAVFFGRGRIAGITPGRRVIVEGVAAKRGNQILLFNPTYQLLP